MPDTPSLRDQSLREVRVGQIYASTHAQDRQYGWRQVRRVVRVDSSFVWLQTEGKPSPSRVRLRNGRIPAHELVMQSDEEYDESDGHA
jgi:hypothetical protein